MEAPYRHQSFYRAPIFAIDRLRMGERIENALGIEIIKKLNEIE